MMNVSQTHTVIATIAIVLAIVALGFSALALFVLRIPPTTPLPAPLATATPSENVFSEHLKSPLFEEPTFTGRGWGPEQATGTPDTFQAGDYETAWASMSADGQQEWLELSFDPVAQGRAVQIYETYNPGAVSKVMIRTSDGSERIIYEALTVPTPTASSRVFEIPLTGVGGEITDVTLTIDSQSVPGWNEIDAVGIRDAEGQLHWATSARASSTFAESQIKPEI